MQCRLRNKSIGFTKRCVEGADRTYSNNVAILKFQQKIWRNYKPIKIQYFTLVKESGVFLDKHGHTNKNIIVILSTNDLFGMSCE